MGKNIWILHHYATPPTMSGMSRPHEIFKHLDSNKYACTVFASSVLHHTGENLITDNKLFIRNNDGKIPFIFVKSSEYKGNGFSRIRNMLSFSFNLFRTMRRLLDTEQKPDIIYASSPHPLTVVTGILMAKKLGIPCITEYRDLWPEAIFVFGKLKENSILGRILVRGEYWLYRNSDAIVFLKEGDVEYIKDRKWDLMQGGDIDLNKCFYINNGVDISLFEQRKSENSCDDPDLKGGKFNVVYTGAIRAVNNVGNILDAAKLLISHEDIQFLIYGDGNELDMLRQRVESEELYNVKIKGYVDKKHIPYILSKSSVNILNYAQDRYNWSRGNSSNKLFEYMASGRPIISTVRMGYCPLKKYECGISLENDTPEELAKEIINIYKMPRSEYMKMGRNAKKAAEKYDYRILSEKLQKVVEDLITQ